MNKPLPVKGIASTIALPKLRFGHDYPGSDVHARRSNRDEGIDELAQSIREEKGILQSLLVCTCTGDDEEAWYVIDGNRRLAALRKIAGDDSSWESYPVPVIVKDGVTPGSALALSIAASIHNLPLHPIDRYEAFAALMPEGSAATPADVAQRFGTTERIVNQALKLGSLAPEIRAAWRAGEITAEAAQIFTLAGEHGDQIKAFDKLKESHRLKDISTIRKTVVKNGTALNRLLNFVGREAYHGAGGTLTEDFFTTTHIIHDKKIVTRLADEKLAAEIKALVDAGWSWAAIKDGPDHQYFSWNKLKAKPAYTPEEKVRLAAIKSRQTAIETATDELEWTSDEYQELMREDERLGEEQERIEARATGRAFSAKQKAESGCLVKIGDDGSLDIEFGVTKPKSAKVEEKKEGSGLPVAMPASARALGGGSSSPSKPSIEQASCDYDSIYEALEAGVSAGLAKDHRLALAGILASLGTQAYDAPIDIELGNNSGGNHLPQFKPTKARSWRQALDEFRKLKVEQLIALLAEAAASAVNIHTRADEDAKSLRALVDQTVLTGAIRKAFDAEAFCKGANKPYLLKVIKEVLGEDERRRNQDKSQNDLAKFVLASIVPLGWLPEELRTKSYVQPKPKASAAAPAKPAPKKKGAKK
jgi:ParB family chromosome partitioning protein